MQNGAGTRSTLWHKSDTASSAGVLGLSRDVPPERGAQREAPEALAGATEADTLHSWVEWLDDTVNRLDAARALSRAIVACHPEDREALLEAALAHLRAGPPVPPFTGVMAEASHWADWASPAELKAYALACFNRLPPADRSAFLGYVQKEAERWARSR